VISKAVVGPINGSSHGYVSVVNGLLRYLGELILLLLWKDIGGMVVLMLVTRDIEGARRGCGMRDIERR